MIHATNQEKKKTSYNTHTHIEAIIRKQRRKKSLQKHGKNVIFVFEMNLFCQCVIDYVLFAVCGCVFIDDNVRVHNDRETKCATTKILFYIYFFFYIRKKILVSFFYSLFCYFQLKRKISIQISLCIEVIVYVFMSSYFSFHFSCFSQFVVAVFSFFYRFIVYI